MTDKKQLKARVRERMARTGERYTAARRHVVRDDVAPLHDDAGYVLRGGTHPETAALTNVLAHHGVVAASTGQPLSEALILGIGGGLGAGYILWEWRQHDARILVLGFRNSWQYPARWTAKTLDRLGIAAETHETSRAKGAAARLSAALATGRPSLVWPDRRLVGYWHLPPHLEAHGGGPVVAYAEIDGGVRVDDRNLRPLTVPRPVLDMARGRIVSYRNRLVTPRPEPGPIADAVLRRAVTDALHEGVAHLGGSSDSFALPAWDKWRRLLTDTRNAKGWPRVFSDRRGLAGALLSVWEGAEPLGHAGGNLRGLYADFLEEAGALLDSPSVAGPAERFREAARLWHELAGTALPASAPDLARLRDLDAAVLGTVTADGDAGRPEAAAAAAELWDLCARLDRSAPLDGAEIAGLFTGLSSCLAEIVAVERAAVDALGRALPA